MEFDHSFGFSLYFFVVVFGCIGCRAQDIGGDFNFRDNGLLYEVIFVGQENVALICHTTGVENATITIRSPEGLDLIRSDGEGNCPEYAFSSVEAGDNGVYTCNIGYIDKLSGEEIFVTKYLEVNVINDEQACFRNGTAQSAYAIGDVLLFSCYCNNITSCLWIRSVPGGRLGDAVPMQDISKVGRVTVVRAIVRPLDQQDLLLRYDCAHSESKDERCSLGPADISASDTVRDISASSVVLPACSETPITSSPVTTSPSSPVMTSKSSPVMTSPNVGPIDDPGDSGGKDDPDNNWIIYIIMAGILLLILFILVVLTFQAITVRRIKKSKAEDDPRSQKIHSNHDPPETNIRYDSGDYGTVDESGVTSESPSVGPVHDPCSYTDTDGYCLPDIGHHGTPSRIPEISRYSASADGVHDDAREPIVDSASSLTIRRGQDRPDNHTMTAVTPTDKCASNDGASKYPSVPGKNGISMKRGENRASRDEYEDVSNPGPRCKSDWDTQYEKYNPVSFGPEQFTIVVRDVLPTGSGEERAGRDDYEAVSNPEPGCKSGEDTPYENPIPVAFGPDQYSVVFRK